MSVCVSWKLCSDGCTSCVARIAARSETANVPSSSFVTPTSPLLAPPSPPPASHVLSIQPHELNADGESDSELHGDDIEENKGEYTFDPAHLTPRVQKPTSCDRFARWTEETRTPLEEVDVDFSSYWLKVQEIPTLLGVRICLSASDIMCKSRYKLHT